MTEVHSYNYCIIDVLVAHKVLVRNIVEDLCV